MAKTENLVLHASYTPIGFNMRKSHLHKWHIIDRGWEQFGYRDMINLKGEVINLVPHNMDGKIDRWEVSNGARGYNHNSIHVVYAGGMYNGKPADTRNEAQFSRLALYVKETILLYPHIRVLGHNEISSKSCPCFDVPTFCLSIGVNKKNIYQFRKKD